MRVCECGVDDVAAIAKRRAIGSFFVLAPRRPAIRLPLPLLAIQGDTSVGLHECCVRGEMRDATGPVLMLPPPTVRARIAAANSLCRSRSAPALCPPFASHHNLTRTSFFRRRNEGCGWMARW